MRRRARVEIDPPIEVDVVDFEEETKTFVERMLKAIDVTTTDSLVTELSSRVSDIIRSVK